MDVKKESMMDGMMDGMMGGMMDGHHTPQSLIRMLAENERMEAALYRQIAQAMPSEELRRIIMHRARHELREAERIEMLSHHFGVMPVGTPGAPMPYSAGEDSQKK